jgi:hypothetical protein
MNPTNVATMYKPICEPRSVQVGNRTVDPDAITISFFENEVPAFVEFELNRLYGNLYSSLTLFRIDGKDRNTSTYVVRKGDSVVTLFLFQHKSKKVQVINQVIQIDEEDISRFSAYIFAHFASTKAIVFDNINSNLKASDFPFQRINISEDIVLILPETEEKYLANLGKNSRRNIKRYSKKLVDTYPSFHFEILVKNQIDEQTIQDIINLNRARMIGKDKVSAIDEMQTERTMRLAKECGVVVVARIGGKVCAGSISFQVGENYFFSVIAHDPKYDDCCLGYLCSYRTICECIARKGNEFHFLWGEYEYKYSLMGIKRELDKIVVYRSRADVFLSARLALDTVIEAYARQAVVWLHKAKRQDSAVSRIAVTSLKFIRRLKRTGQEIFSVRKEGVF